jgi:hypothetical protein
MTNSADPDAGANWPTDGSFPTTIVRYHWGPPSDYAIPSAFARDGTNGDSSQRPDNSIIARDAGGSDQYDHGTLCPGQYDKDFSRLPRDMSPFRSAIVLGDAEIEANAKMWQPRDDMSWWADGTSNQLVTGEKYMAPDELYSLITDGTWLFMRDNLGAGTFRIVHFYSPLARSGIKEYSTQPNNAFRRFGSWHPGVCQFAIGDGSVRAFPCTTPVNVLFPLHVVNDGNAIALP